MSNISPWFVMVLGMFTVFLGLIVLILFTNLMSKLLRPHHTKEVQA